MDEAALLSRPFFLDEMPDGPFEGRITDVFHIQRDNGTLCAIRVDQASGSVTIGDRLYAGDWTGMVVDIQGKPRIRACLTWDLLVGGYEIAIAVTPPMDRHAYNYATIRAVES